MRPSLPLRRRFDPSFRYRVAVGLPAAVAAPLLGRWAPDHANGGFATALVAGLAAAVVAILLINRTPAKQLRWTLYGLAVEAIAFAVAITIILTS